MQGVRSSSRWLLSGPSTRRQCLLSAGRGIFYHRPQRGLRQFSARGLSREDRDDATFKRAGLDEKGQDPQSGGDVKKLAHPATNTPFRSLIFLVFPFGGRATSTRSPQQSIRQRGGFRWAALWLYRIVWLLGMGYAGSIYLLPSSPSSEGHAVFYPPRFTPFSIIDRQDVSPTSFILTLRPHKSVSPDIEPYANSWDQGTWSVEFKQPQLQIARSYTPLPPSLDAQSSPDLRFLIRRENGGEVSNYLANLPMHATIDIRGPHPEIDLPVDTTDIVFLAGGTGIAPAMQVAYTLLEKRTDTQRPKIRIIWANRKRIDCVGGVSSSGAKTSGERKVADRSAETVVRELQLMQRRHPEHLFVEYLVDEEGTFVDQKMISTFTGKAAEDRPESGTSSKLLFVSGPEGFVNLLAGPKRWEDGKEKQGELGGVIGKMGLKGWQVWKM